MRFIDAQLRFSQLREQSVDEALARSRRIDDIIEHIRGDCCEIMSSSSMRSLGEQKETTCDDTVPCREDTVLTTESSICFRHDETSSPPVNVGAETAFETLDQGLGIGLAHETRIVEIVDELYARRLRKLHAAVGRCTVASKLASWRHACQRHHDQCRQHCG